MATATTRRGKRPFPKPVTLDQVTPEMLAPIQQIADETWLAQTVYPSKWVGRDYMGRDCLLTSSASVMETAPSDAAPGLEPFLCVLPERYLTDLPRGRSTRPAPPLA